MRRKQLDQLLAIRVGLGEQLAGVEKDHRGRRIDRRDHVEQHGALGAERGDQRGPAGERAFLEQRAQQGEAVEPCAGAAQIVEMLEHAQGAVLLPPALRIEGWLPAAAQGAGTDS